MPVLVKGKKCPHCAGDAPKSECNCGSMAKAKACSKCGCDDCVSKHNCGGDVKKALFSNAWAFLKQDDDPLGRALAANSGPRETPPTLQLPGMVNTADEPTRNDVDMATGGASAPNPFIPDSIKYPMKEQITDMLRDKRDIQNFVDELRNRSNQGEIEPPEPDNSVSEGPDWRDDR